MGRGDWICKDVDKMCDEEVKEGRLMAGQMAYCESLKVGKR